MSPGTESEVTEIDLQLFFAGYADRLSARTVPLARLRQISFAPADPAQRSNPTIAAAGHPILLTLGIAVLLKNQEPSYPIKDKPS
jgi:hypothetical protein